MAYSNQSTLIVDQILKRAAVADANAESDFINRICAPQVSHGHEKGEITILDPEWTLRLEDKTKMLKGPGDSKPLAIDARFGSIEFQIKVRHLMMEVTKDELDLFQSNKQARIPQEDPARVATSLLTHQMESIIEKEYLDTILTAGSYAANSQDTRAAGTELDVATVDADVAIQGYVLSFLLQNGRKPNKAIMSTKGWMKLSGNPFLRQKLGSGDTFVTEEQFSARYLQGGSGVIQLADARYIPEKEGQATQTKTAMMDNDIVFAYVAPERMLMPGMVEKTFSNRVVNNNYIKQVYRKPFEWDTEGFHVILRDSWGFLFPGVDTAATGKIDSGFLVVNAVTA